MRKGEKLARFRLAAVPGIMSGDDIEEINDTRLLQMGARGSFAVVGRHATAQPARGKCAEHVMQAGDRLLRRCCCAGVKAGEKRDAVLAGKEAQDLGGDFG